MVHQYGLDEVVTVESKEPLRGRTIVSARFASKEERGFEPFVGGELTSDRRWQYVDLSRLGEARVQAVVELLCSKARRVAKQVSKLVQAKVVAAHARVPNGVAKPR